MKLFDSLSREIKELVPLEKGKVKLYVCGITPYDTTHIGHAFTYLSFDVLIRYLSFKGYQIEYTQNVTDIDDDILKRAKALNTDWKKLGQEWTDRFLIDLKSLNLLSPTYYVKATDSIEKIIEINKSLIEKNHAYESDGNVYFETSTFSDYGKLSHYSKEEMLALSRERGANPDDPRKKGPLDFILWQKSLSDEPSWDSPWGKGRPGWHIECSAMISQYLGDQIDIHGGGFDLIYPHHESEIAQSESFTEKKPYVSDWMHTAMVMYEGEKMSKSLGNLVLARDLLKTYSPNAIRWALISHHYREQWEFTEDQVQKAEIIIDNILNLIKGIFAKEERNTVYITKFTQTLDNDLNTPEALKVLDTLVEEVAQTTDEDKKIILLNTLKEFLLILGFILP